MTTSLSSQKIRILPESLINKIAAGEVVERPASVVKELVENAIDAGSSQLQVTVKNGGKDLIQVLDNGGGMSEADARFAVERHATSKIYTDDDLFQIETLGFRGEALASIAAVSHFELTTCAGEDQSGVRLVMKGGRLEEISKVGFPQGTRIKVEQLFFNTPARLKFLKSTPTEMQHIQQGIINQSLAHPELQCKLVHNQQVLLSLSGDSTLEERVHQLFGEEFRDGLQEVRHEETYLRYHGWISIPERVRTSRRWQYLLVNGRFVKCPSIQRAIYQSYGAFLSKTQHPAFFLHLHLHPSEIDVNVHPAKTEIRLRNSQVVHTILQDHLGKALRHKTKLRLFGRENGAASRTLSAPQRQSALPLADDLPPQQTIQEAHPSDDTAPARRPSRSAPTPPTAPATSLDHSPPSREVRQPEVTPPPVPRAADQPTPSATEALSENIELWPRDAWRHERFTPIAQVLECYLLATEPEGLVLFHTQRLHERLLYEKYRADFLEKQSETRVFATPRLLNFSPQDVALLDALLPLLRRGGFGIEPFGGRTYALQQQPHLLPEDKSDAMLLDLIAQSALFGKRGRADMLQPDLWQTVAKHAALPATSPLPPTAQQALLGQLEGQALDNRAIDGAPLWFALPQSELKRKFQQRF
jgi:DNA mismatch repair protein MutL